jgi:hypothetical protein
MRLYLGGKQHVIIFGGVLTQRANDEPAVVPKTSEIVEESLGIKSYFHFGKVFL